MRGERSGDECREGTDGGGGVEVCILSNQLNVGKFRTKTLSCGVIQGDAGDGVEHGGRVWSERRLPQRAGGPEAPGGDKWRPGQGNHGLATRSERKGLLSYVCRGLNPT